jgi:hypothetical protein
MEENTFSTLTIGIAGSFIAGILLPTLIKAIYYFLGRILGARKPTDISGVYDCEYHIPWKPEGSNIIFERILILKIGRKFYGYLINNPDDSQYRRLENPGRRLVGELFVEQFFIGSWSHPLPDDRTAGAFNMKIDLSGRVHTGQWNGESSTYKRILEGRWIWRKNTSVRYGAIRLVKEMIFKAAKK